MNILTDFHHLGLLNSLYLLFEKRLGHKLYRQIGMSWAENGYWHVYDHPDTQKQYLLDGYYPKDQTPPLNSVARHENGIHIIKDTFHNTEQRAITLSQFKEMPIDMVIASIPQHVKPFKELITKYKPAAKFIFQQGNMFHEVINNLHEIPNLLSSTISFPVPPTCNAVFYHQEFDTKLFKPDGTQPKKQITSFINLLPRTQWGEQYKEMRIALPEYEFRSYGILTSDGIISGIKNIADIMKSSMFGWHAKYMGDGFGHILYNWYATGKPIITHISDYQDKLGRELLTDGETCFDLGTRSIQEVCSYIRDISEEKYHAMCDKVYQRFIQVVNYDQEEIKIKSWLERLNG